MRPRARPITPPTAVSMIASSVNCSRMSRLRAPMALRTPISRVRSVTETSMMFITPTPPTIKPTLETANMKMKIMLGDLVPHVGKRVLGEDGEIVRLVGRNPAAAAQQLAHFVYGFGHVGVRSGLDADQVLLQFGVQFAKRGQREIDLVVVGIFAAAERALDLLATPITVNNWPSMFISLPSGSLTREKLFRGIVRRG